MGAAADLAVHRLAVGTLSVSTTAASRTRPSASRAGTLAPARYTLGDARRAQDAGPAELDVARTRRMGGESTGEGDGAEFVVGAAVCSCRHGVQLIGDRARGRIGTRPAWRLQLERLSLGRPSRCGAERLPNLVVDGLPWTSTAAHG